MVEYRIRKSQLKGAIVVPSSKSQTLRAILFASMAKGKSSIHKYLHSPDTDAMIEACRLFGAKIEVYPSSLNIEGLDGQISHAEDIINAGNSGIVLRFCTALGALASRPVVITGDYSIRHQRPMKELLSGLNQLGVSATSMRGDGYAPVIIQGPLKQGHAVIQGSDSQPVSALLIAAADNVLPAYQGESGIKTIPAISISRPSSCCNCLNVVMPQTLMFMITALGLTRQISSFHHQNTDLFFTPTSSA